MNLLQAISDRRSIRKFLSTPVPHEIIKEILEQASWCPSWGNTQPWEVTVVTGQALENLKKQNREALLSGIEPTSDFSMTKDWPKNLKKRYADVGKKVFTSLNIARDDKKGREQHSDNMFSFFHAPALLIFTVDSKVASEYAALDVGIFMQNISLLAHAKNLGTCILAAAIHFPAIIRRICKTPHDRFLVMGIAMGYPDTASPVNNFERERIGETDFVKWVS